MNLYLSAKGKCTILLVSCVCILLISYQHVVDLYVVNYSDQGLFGFNFGFEAQFGLETSEGNNGSDIIDAVINQEKHNITNNLSSSQNDTKNSLKNSTVSAQLGQTIKELVNSTSKTSTELETSPESLKKSLESSLEPVQGSEASPEPVKSGEAGHCRLQDSSLPACPPIPAHLVGRLKVDLKTPTWAEVAKVSLGEAKPGIGGGFSPLDCVAKDKVALVLPYRNRPDQLRTFLNHIHPILMRQDIQYQIFIVNQAGDNIFNRAMLFNVGFVEAMKLCDWDCIVFHDVDLLPEDDRNLYTCPEQPRHLSVAVNKFNYKLPYADIFGGAGVLTTEHFKLVNGFSNQFWGWGGEDDNMSDRIRHHKLKITRYKNEIARYTMIKHSTEASNKANPQRFNLLKAGKAYFDKDGLNNLQYKLVSIDFENLYTNLTVIIDKVDVTK